MAIGSLSLVTFNNLGMGDTTSDLNTIVKEKIKFFLQTNKGEIVADINYGADLIHFTMGSLDARLIQQLSTAVRTELALNMPYVVVKRLENVSKQDQGSLYFTLFYEVNGIEDNVNIGV